MRATARFCVPTAMPITTAKITKAVSSVSRTTVRNLTMETIEPRSLDLVMLFEYMIGNTDFSIMEQHNVRLVQTQAGQRFAVPYDFDYSGLADASYATPSKALPITSVRDRLFRGPCRTAAEWPPYVDQLRAVKP